MKVLIIDNYDSFTYNLYQYIGEILSAKDKDFVLNVDRNDAISLADIKKRAFDRIVISPGPGDPSDKEYFGVCSEVLATVGKTIPVLGVCLGMQGMAGVWGGKVVRAKKPMHGKSSIITHNGAGIFRGLPQKLEVMRYHSLIVDTGSLPDILEITAIVSERDDRSNIEEPSKGTGFIEAAQISKMKTEDIEIMGLRHKEYPIEGVQFHPESFATEGGKMILENFLMRDI